MLQVQVLLHFPGSSCRPHSPPFLLVVPLIHDLAPGFDRQGSEHFSLSTGAKVQPEISPYYWNLRARGYSSARANHLSQYRGGGVQNHHTFKVNCLRTESRATFTRYTIL